MYQIIVESIPEDYTGTALDKEGKTIYFFKGKEVPSEYYNNSTISVEVALVKGTAGAGFYISEPEKGYPEYMLQEGPGIYYFRYSLAELIMELDDQLSRYGYQVTPK